MGRAVWMPLPQCRLQPGVELWQIEVSYLIVAVRTFVQNSQRIALVENEHFIAGALTMYLFLSILTSLKSNAADSLILSHCYKGRMV